MTDTGWPQSSILSQYLIAISYLGILSQYSILVSYIDTLSLLFYLLGLQFGLIDAGWPRSRLCESQALH